MGSKIGRQSIYRETEQGDAYRKIRPLTGEEQNDLESISRARSAPVEAVIRAKILLAVANGMNFTQAAQQVGRKSNDAVSALVRRFNQEGLAALLSRHGGGFQP